MQSDLYTLSHLILTTVLWVDYYWYSYYIDKKTKSLERVNSLPKVIEPERGRTEEKDGLHVSSDLRSMRIVNIKEDLEEGILLLGDLKTCRANICWELKSVLNCWAPGTNWDLRKPLWIKGFVALLEWVTFIRLSWGDSLWISMLNAEKPPARDLFSSVTCWFSDSVNHSFPLSPNKTYHIL